MFEDFSKRVSHNMEVALHRGWQLLPEDRQDERSREFIAERIMESARDGHDLLNELIDAAVKAVQELPPRMPRW